MAEHKLTLKTALRFFAPLVIQAVIVVLCGFFGISGLFFDYMSPFFDAHPQAILPITILGFVKAFVLLVRYMTRFAAENVQLGKKLRLEPRTRGATNDAVSTSLAEICLGCFAIMTAFNIYTLSQRADLSFFINSGSKSYNTTFMIAFSLFPIFKKRSNSPGYEGIKDLGRISMNGIFLLVMFIPVLVQDISVYVSLRQRRQYTLTMCWIVLWTGLVVPIAMILHNYYQILSKRFSRKKNPRPTGGCFSDNGAVATVLSGLSRNLSANYTENSHLHANDSPTGEGWWPKIKNVLKWPIAEPEEKEIESQSAKATFVYSAWFLFLSCILIICLSYCGDVWIDRGLVSVLQFAYYVLAILSSVPDTIVSIKSGADGEIDASVSNSFASCAFNNSLGFAPWMLIMLPKHGGSLDTSDITERVVLVNIITDCAVLLVFAIGFKSGNALPQQVKRLLSLVVYSEKSADKRAQFDAMLIQKFGASASALRPFGNKTWSQMEAGEQLNMLDKLMPHIPNNDVLESALTTVDDQGARLIDDTEAADIRGTGVTRFTDFVTEMAWYHMILFFVVGLANFIYIGVWVTKRENA